jgi:hypothetical protein
VFARTGQFRVDFPPVTSCCLAEKVAIARCVQQRFDKAIASRDSSAKATTNFASDKRARRARKCIDAAILGQARQQISEATCATTLTWRCEVVPRGSEENPDRHACRLPRPIRVAARAGTSVCLAARPRGICAFPASKPTHFGWPLPCPARVAQAAGCLRGCLPARRNKLRRKRWGPPDLPRERCLNRIECPVLYSANELCGVVYTNSRVDGITKLW